LIHKNGVLDVSSTELWPCLQLMPTENGLRVTNITMPVGNLSGELIYKTIQQYRCWRS